REIDGLNGILGFADDAAAMGLEHEFQPVSEQRLFVGDHDADITFVVHIEFDSSGRVETAAAPV
ncbi:MAG: hypothetical protein DMG03_04965, partial [Acidobacteria bacterium]